VFSRDRANVSVYLSSQNVYFSRSTHPSRPSAYSFLIDTRKISYEKSFMAVAVSLITLSLKGVEVAPGER